MSMSYQVVMDVIADLEARLERAKEIKDRIGELGVVRAFLHDEAQVDLSAQDHAELMKLLLELGALLVAPVSEEDQ